MRSATSANASRASSNLRDLLSHLDVDGAAPLARRGGGVNDTVEMADTGEGFPNTGTSDGSTLLGVPLTVVSGLDMDLDEPDESITEEGQSPNTWKSRTVPRSVRYDVPKHVGPAKTFSVMRLSQDLDVFSVFCRATIGKSGTFCIARNCPINHKGPVAKIKPGSLIVIKTAGKAAFLNPVIRADILEQSLLGDWLSTQETLESWSTKFDQVLGSSAFVTKVNAASLEITCDEERRAADFKTPRAKKRRSMDLDSTERIGISPYARVLVNGPEAFEDMSNEEQMEKLIQMAINLDAGVDQLGSFYVSLNQEIEKSGNLQGLSNQMMEHKVTLIRRILGSKPEHLKSEIEAPTVWGALAALLERIDSAPAELPSFRKQSIPTDLTKRMTSLDSDLMATASTLSKAIQAQGQRIDSLQLAGGPLPVLGDSVDVSSAVALGEEVKNIRSELLRINTENKPHVVKFAGLNLDSLSKAKSWINTHVSVEDVCLVVDPHTVFEHIYANLNGGEFLKNFERVHKLNISTLSQGYSMSSFEQAIPKIFSKAGSVVIKDDSSYLSRVPTWNDWDYPDTGLRQTILHELEIFQRAHRSEIENTLEPEARIYGVACLALSDSVSIVEAVVKFVDDFVKHLTTAKFSFKKAFHVTSRLTKRILTEMYDPRQGILKSFKTGNLEQTAGSIFWATIRSLDIGLRFKRTGFGNLHIVSSELVKFLLVNTGYESISTLELKVSTLETQNAELLKTSKNAEKSAIASSNKSDELKKLCDTLVKRVAKLETRS
jgi:hypothetical protein